MDIEPHFREQPPQSFNIDEELNLVLDSTSFQGSRQCQSLLKYLVENSFGGQDGDGSLKERTIGIEVFGRKHDYDTADDAIVRARVGEVRKRLALYYQSPEAQKSAIQIIIPRGSYRPRFALLHEESAATKEPPFKEEPQPAQKRSLPEADALIPKLSSSRRSRLAQWRIWGIAALAICAVLSVAWIQFAHWSESELDLFWKPFFDSKKSVVVYVGTAQLYVPTAASAEKAVSLSPAANQKQPMTAWHVPALVPGQVLTANDVRINQRDFVAVGDIGAVVDTVQLLTAHHRSLDLRSGPNMPFQDLRTSPLILTGAGSNFWALDMTRDLPFFLDGDLRIRERGGQGQVWSTPLWSDHAITEDYAIVSRLLDSKTGAPIIMLAGITMCGTRAAGEFVTDPVQMKMLRRIPRDALEHKNLEFVLHATLVDCEPTSMDIASMRYW